MIELPHSLPVDSQEWRSDRFLVFDAVNDGPYMADLECRLKAADGEMSVRLGLFPGLKTRLVLPLAYLDGERVIPGRTPYRFKCVCRGGPLRPEDVTEARLVGLTPGGRAGVRISRPELRDSLPEEWPQAEEPIVDELHQWAGHRWPGKTRSIEAVRARVTEELLTAEPETLPERDQWGGWTGGSFGEAEFFRTHHDGGRWWLVDPDGHPFFSLGVDCVRPSIPTETGGNEDLFTELPGRDGPFARCWREGRHGRKTIFDALQYNLRRALGDAWLEHWMELCSRRLRRWGFNTVGNWSDIRFCRGAGLPYVHPLRSFPTTEKRIFRDFPDVFADQYSRNSARFAEQLENLRGDHQLIGYFLRNEPHWAFGEHNLVAKMLESEEQFASRDAFVEWLRERYGQIGTLNRKWGTELGSFRALAAEPQRTERFGKAAREDMRQFNRRMIERYVRVPSEECKKVDPHHLNLGVRYAWIAHEDLLAGADVFDVFSINAYGGRPPEQEVARCAEAAEAPVLIGEFHTGALDRGLPNGGLRVVSTQQDRADSYRHYVEHAAAIPQLVGAHYFQWNDQHVAGRFDGENWQIGLVDICQRAYRQLGRSARRSHSKIYRLAVGEAEPYERLPEAIEMT